MSLPPVILASASPRRSELLASLGIAFSIHASHAEELHDENMPLEELCRANAELKAHDIARFHPGSLVIAADTLVGLNGTPFAKPRDLGHAAEMLRTLSGHTHHVITGVCLIFSSRIESFTDRTEVTFRNLTEQSISEYLRLVPVLDKAGAYAIQERGEMLVEKISGSFTNVVGFPVEKFSERLREFSAHGVTSKR